MIIELADEWKGATLTTCSHCDISFISGLVRMSPDDKRAHNKTYFYMILKRCPKIDVQICDFFPGTLWFYSCLTMPWDVNQEMKMQDKSVHRKWELKTSRNQPSSSFSRYLSKIVSSLTTCCVAEDRIDAR